MLKKIPLFFALLLFPLLIQASDGYYLGAFGGVNFLHKSHTHTHLRFKEGYNVTLTAGYAFFDVFRAEVEGTFHRNNIRNIRFNNQKFHCGHNRDYVVMGNLLYDVYFGSRLVPYVGFGVGFERNRFLVSAPNHRFHRDRRGFARQLILGLTYPLCCTVDMSLDFRLRRGVRHNLSQALSLGIKKFF